MTDRDVQIELNFIDEFELSRQGMIDEIKTEFDIIRFCVSNMTKYKISAREMFDRIMIMPLKKLLCEKNSVLLKVCPDFKMFPLDGQDTALNDGLHAVLPPLGFVSQKNGFPWRIGKLKRLLTLTDQKLISLDGCQSTYMTQYLML